VFAQQLEYQERGVALVQMPHLWMHPKRAKRSNTADAEDHLLAYARGLIASVQPMSDVPVRGRILGTVRVEQIKRDAARPGLPESRKDIATRDAHRDLENLPVTLAYRLDRQIARIVLDVFRVLDSIV